MAVTLKDIHALIAKGQPIENLIFSGSSFIEANLGGANFINCQFIKCQFNKSKIEQINFIGSIFSNCSFNNATLLDASFIECEFNNTQFTQAMINGSNWVKPMINGCDFTASVGQEANFIEGHLQECHFDQADLEFSSFMQCTMNDCHFNQARLVRTNYIECTFTDISFRNALMHTTIFEKPELNNQDFSTMDLTQTQFRNAKLNGCSFKSSILVQTAFVDAELNHCDFTQAQCSMALFSGSELTQSKLIQCQLEQASFQGSNLTACNLSSSRLIQAQMTQTHCIGTLFTGSDLSYADLSLAVCDRADFGNTSLFRTNLHGIIDSGSNWSGSSKSMARAPTRNLSALKLGSLRTPPLTWKLYREFMHTQDIALALTKPHEKDNQHAFGEVISTDKGIIKVKLSHAGLVIIAKKAFSCTFDPMVQDTVELTQHDNQTYYVLNILERTQSCAAMLSVPFGLEIKSPSIDMQSNALGIENQNMRVNARQFNQQSESIKLNTDSAQFSSRTVESNIDRLIQRLKDSFKIIERIEQVSAVDIIQNIKNAFIQRSRQVDITAKSDVKINGDRIHMG